MEIEVKVTATTEVAVDFTVIPLEHRFPGPPDAPRYRFVFSDDLVLERIDNKKPGNGLRESPQNRLAGTHSGFGTTLRAADANDKFFPGCPTRCRRSRCLPWRSSTGAPLPSSR